jgi:hypothetical protein
VAVFGGQLADEEGKSPAIPNPGIVPDVNAIALGTWPNVSDTRLVEKLLVQTTHRCGRKSSSRLKLKVNRSTDRFDRAGQGRSSVPPTVSLDRHAMAGNEP